jgi:hypothetical protein
MLNTPPASLAGVEGSMTAQPRISASTHSSCCRTTGRAPTLPSHILPGTEVCITPYSQNLLLESPLERDIATLGITTTPSLDRVSIMPQIVMNPKLPSVDSNPVHRIVTQSRAPTSRKLACRGQGPKRHVQPWFASSIRTARRGAELLRCRSFMSVSLKGYLCSRADSVLRFQIIVPYAPSSTG